MRHLNDLTLGRYIYGESVIHRLDPRTKLLCALVFMVGVFAVGRIPGILAYLAVTVALFPLAGISINLFWKNLRVFLMLFVITFLIHLFVHPGEIVLQLPFTQWGVTVEGLVAGILFTVRIAVLIAVSSLLMLVTTPQDLTDALERLLKPLSWIKVPVHESTLIISIAIRFVPILMAEANKIRQAQLARGADLEGWWLMRIKKSVPMVLPLFASALKRADTLALALEARGYRGGTGRCRLMELQLKWIDGMALSTTLVLIAILLRLS